MIPLKAAHAPGAGFLALVYPFEKVRVLQVLKNMGINYEFESDEALQYYVTELPEEFLVRYRGTVLHADIFKRCVINKDDNTISFITQHGILLNSETNGFAIGKELYLFNSSDRYEICFIPAVKDSEAYNFYK